MFRLEGKCSFLPILTPGTINRATILETLLNKYIFLKKKKKKKMKLKCNFYKRERKLLDTLNLQPEENNGGALKKAYESFSDQR